MSDEYDWLLTERVKGEDCTYSEYRQQPERLCDVLATTLKELHSMDFSDCPVQNKTADYLALAEKNYRAGMFDPSYLMPNVNVTNADEAWRMVEGNKHLLKADTLLHGDYCLPNVMLKDWQVSGLIDLGNGGVGDRHVDLYWGAWTLEFNLHTDAYRQRFFDAYGRDLIDEERLLLVSAAEVFG